MRRSRIPRQRTSELPLMVNLRWRRKQTRLSCLLKNHGARQFQTDDPTEMEIKGAADKLATMMNSSQPQANVFFQPDNLGALPHLWLQAKLTISLTSMQEKFARLFMSIAAEGCYRYGGRSFYACSPQLHAPACRNTCAVHELFLTSLDISLF